VARTFAQSRRLEARSIGVSRRDMSEEALSSHLLRKAAAHFACRNARSAEAEMGGSEDEMPQLASGYA
jgi:hypothetical protein